MSVRRSCSRADGLVQLQASPLAYIRIRELTPLTRDLEAFTFPMRVARLDALSPEAVIDLLLPPEEEPVGL